MATKARTVHLVMRSDGARSEHETRPFKPVAVATNVHLVMTSERGSEEQAENSSVQASFAERDFFFVQVCVEVDYIQNRFLVGYITISVSLNLKL